MKSRTDWTRIEREASAGIEPDLSQPEDKEGTAAEFLAAITKKRAGRPISATHKTPLSLRLSDDVVELFKSTGKGWQMRINEALREYVREHHSA
jgi:uncharacterized protein (DUF4415 family)